MQRLRKEEGVTFLFIEHDMEVVMNHSDRVIVMANGRVIADGTPDEVRGDEKVIDAYLGAHAAEKGLTERPRRAGRGAASRGERRGAERQRGASSRPTTSSPATCDEVDILNGVSMTVREGEIVTVIGPNGAGKSTLIKTIFGLLHPRTGHDHASRASDIAGCKPHQLVRGGLGYVPQLDNVFPSLTVDENLEMGSLDPKRSGEQMQRMYELFPRLGERRDQAAGTMSGGERQMVAMAKALMPDPKLLLLDEPSAGLAPAFVDAIFEKVEEINRAGVTIVMVEQNARRALAMSHRGYVLDVGKNRYEGTRQGPARRPQRRPALPRRDRARGQRRGRRARPRKTKRPGPEPRPLRSHSCGADAPRERRSYSPVATGTSPMVSGAPSVNS